MMAGKVFIKRDSWKLVLLLVMGIFGQIAAAAESAEIKTADLSAEDIIKIANARYETSKSEILYLYQVVLDNWSGIQSGNAEVNKLKGQVKEAIGKGEYEKVHELIEKTAETEMSYIDGLSPCPVGDAKSVIDTLIVKADLHFAVPEYNMAIEMCRKALEYCPVGEKELKADVLVKLGGYLFEMAIFDEAEEKLLEAIGIYTAESGDEYKKTLEAKNKLMFVYTIQYKLEKAAKIKEGLSATIEKVYGENNQELINFYYSSAYFSNLASDFDDHKLESLKILDLIRKSEKIGITELVYGLNMQAERLVYDNKYVEAGKLSERTLQIAEEAYGNSHPEINESLHNSYNYQMRTDRLIEAQNLANRMVQYEQKYHGIQHPMYADSLANLAAVYMYYDHYFLSKATFTKAHDLLKEHFSDEHYLICFAKIWMARAAIYDYEIEEAEKLYKDALQATENAYIQNKMIIEYCNSGLGRAMLYNGEFSKAIKYYDKALEIERSYPVPNKLNISYILLDLAHAYDYKEEYKPAIEKSKESLEIMFDFAKENYAPPILEHLAAFHAELLTANGMKYNDAARKVIAMAPELVSEDWFCFEPERKIITEF